MKKLKAIALVIVSCLILTGCSCQKTVQKYTVTFDANGGSAVVNQSVEDGKKATKPADPTRDGYDFAGWYVSEDATEEYDFSKAITGNITLTARWALASGGDEPTPTHTPSGDDKPSETVNVTSVKASKSALSLTVGGSEKLKITINPSNATNKTITYKSSNTKVATVDKNGNVKAVKEGTATITATVDGKSTTVKVTVSAKEETPAVDNTPKTDDTPKTVAVTGVSLNKSSLTLTIGDSETLTATVSPSDATNKNVTWSSSDSSVATVANGKVTAVKAGTATIKVTTEDVSKEASLSVTVKDKAYTYSISACPSDSGYDSFKCASVYYGNDKLTLVTGDKLMVGSSTKRATVTNGMITVDESQVDNITKFYNSNTGTWVPITKR